jgi:hypothetical protein
MFARQSMTTFSIASANHSNVPTVLRKFLMRLPHTSQAGDLLLPQLSDAMNTCPRCSGLTVRESVEADCTIMQWRCLLCGNRIEPGHVMDNKRKYVIQQHPNSRRHAPKKAA